MAVDPTIKAPFLGSLLPNQLTPLGMTGLSPLSPGKERRRLSREWTFDATHRLTNHPGKCYNCHGHTWRVLVTVEGPVSPGTGMVMDFFKLKEIGDKLFDDLWDHTAILARWDPLVPALLKLTPPSRVYLVDAEPTSEVLAGIAGQHFEAALAAHPDVSVVEVHLYETPKCSAATTYCPKPQSHALR